MELYPDTIAHLRINWARRRLTSLIEVNTLTTTPKHQTETYKLFKTGFFSSSDSDRLTDTRIKGIQYLLCSAKLAIKTIMTIMMRIIIIINYMLRRTFISIGSRLRLRLRSFHRTLFTRLDHLW